MAAYTSVSTRRHLDRPLYSESAAYPSHTIYVPPPKPAAPPPPQPKKIEWPQSVRDYVQRAFEMNNAIPSVSSEDMQVKLRAVINDAAERQALHSLDWTTMPLPQQLILDERMAKARTQPVSPWQGQTRMIANEHVLDTNHALHTSKKRKSTEMSSDGNLDQVGAQPPWRDVNSRNVFENRITYSTPAQAIKMDKRQRKNFADNSSPIPSSKSQGDLERRKQRFENGKGVYVSPTSYLSPREGSPFPDANQGPVVGLCQQLEKNYFRLTSAPKPETVRPQPVLEKTLELLKTKWRKENNYSYICDQFKSLRQDLTVQHIKNEFTVSVYEIHARIALEKGDLGEYNQCQTQLRALYLQNLGGHPAEFLAYRILYFIHTCNRRDMSNLLADLTAADKEEAAVKHALAVRSALALGNYHRFFRLYLDTPNMGAYLMDMFIVRERLVGLANMCKAYKPDLQLRFVTEELAFESDLECIEFLSTYGGSALLDESKGDGIRVTTGKAGPLFEAAKNAAFRTVDIKGQI